MIESNQVCIGCLHELEKWCCVNRDCPINGSQLTECNHQYFSDMVKTKKGYELHCSNCGFNYGLLGQVTERRNRNAE